MDTNILKTLALLKVNWESPQKKDYLEIFLPILIESIKLIESDQIPIDELSSILSKKFGLSLPYHIIELLLKRARKRKLLIAKDKILIKNHNEIEKYSLKNEFKDKQKDIIYKYENLIHSIQKYSKEKFSLEWKTSYSEKLLLEYLDINGVTILSSLTSGIPLKQILKKGRSTENNLYVIASYILDAEKNGYEEFEYFESIVEGNILASSIYLPNIGKVHKKFTNTKFYFDTTFIIYALGYAGKPREEAAQALLELLRNNTKGLYCFEHTLIEIEKILDAIANSLSPLNSKTAYGYAGEYFIAEDKNESDVLLYKNQLRENIKSKLNFSIVETPEYNEYTINENDLDETIQKALDQQSELARYRDVDSVSAIIRLREGRKSNQIEECRAVFITTNLILAKETKTFFQKKGYSHHHVPPCITDHRLTAHVWLKMPTKAPNLSKKRIIADCYASVQPSLNFWKLYVDEIEKLKGSGNISEDIYYMLRYDLSTKNHLMDQTFGSIEVFNNPDIFINGTIQELVKHARENIAKGINEDIAKKLKDRMKKIKEETKIKEEEIEKQKREIISYKATIKAKKIKNKSTSKTTSKIIVITLELLAIIALLTSAYSSFKGTSLINDYQSMSYLIIVSALAIPILGFLNMHSGKTVKSILGKVENFLESKTYQLLEKIHN